MSAAAIEPPPGTEAAMRGASALRPVPRLFPDELRTPPAQRPTHEAEPPWRRVQPANPANALQEIAGKIFTEKDRAEIQAFEDSLGKLEADRKKHCDPKALAEKLWDAEHDLNLSSEQLASRALEIEEARRAIPQWELALNRQDEQIKEALRPYALRLAAELPGRIAQAIHEIEAEGGPPGPMQFWGIGQGFDAAVILHPLHRLHELSESWLKALERNNCEARACRIRAILADSGALKPKVFLFRSGQF